MTESIRAAASAVGCVLLTSAASAQRPAGRAGADAFVNGRA